MSSSYDKASILIVTVTPVEQDAVFRIFKEETGRSGVQKGAYIDLGPVGTSRVWMVISGMGSEGTYGSTLTIRKAIDDLDPEAIIMVGIAFGVNENEQHIGDILVSTEIIPYENQRVGEKIILRGSRPPATGSLLRLISTAGVVWRQHNEAKVHYGPILSGSKLIDNLEFRNKLIESTPPPAPIGGEMEGTGLCFVAAECKKDWVLIKSICDWADGRKGEDKKNRQSLAAENAARFTLHVLRNGIFPVHVKQAPQPAIQVEAELDSGKLQKVVDRIQNALTCTNYSDAVANAKEASAQNGEVGERFQHDDPHLEVLLGKFWTNYAVALIYAEGFDKALPLLRRLIQRLETRQAFYESYRNAYVQREYHLVLGRAYNHLGYGYWMDAGHYEAALRELHKALAQFMDGRWEQELATAYDNLGRVYAILGFRNRAESLIRHGLQVRTRIENNDYRRALSLNSSAIVQLYYGHYFQGLLESEQALDLFHACISQNGSRGYGLGLITKARALRMLGSHWRFARSVEECKLYLEKAVDALRDAQEIFAKVDEEIRVLEIQKEFGCLYREFYLLCKKAGDQDNALMYLDQAMEKFNEIENSPKAIIYPVIYADAYHDLSVTYYLQRDYSTAEKTIEKAVSHVPAIYLENLRNLGLHIEECNEDYWQELGKIYALKGDLAFQAIRFPDGYYDGEPLDDEPSNRNLNKLKAAFRFYMLAAAYFSRFLHRPISPENLVYPAESQNLESHFRFGQNLYERLSRLTERDLKFLRANVYIQTVDEYQLDIQWVDRFFKQPYDLLIRKSTS